MKRLFVAMSVVIALVANGCDSGGGGAVPFYVTDAPGDQFPGVEITLFDVNLCDDHLCEHVVNLFHADAGLAIDLVGLDGVWQYLTTANIPGGTYNRLELILGNTATITDDTAATHPAYFAPMSANPSQPNEVLCPAGLIDRCLIRFNGAVQPFAMDQFVVDFDLKDFEVEMTPCVGVLDPASWCITQVKMQPLTPAEADAQPVFKIIGDVTELFASAFSIEAAGQGHMVDLGSVTLCTINGSDALGGASCLPLIEVGMCVEVTTHEDPFTSSHLGAIRVESVDGTQCGGV
jgi:hypothetical protein